MAVTDPVNDPQPAEAKIIASKIIAKGRGARLGWLVLGCVLVGIGLIGMFVPLLPTVDFMLLALPCFARSSPRLEAWLLNHPRWGPPLRAWRDHKAVSRHAKMAACGGMALGYGLFVLLARPRLVVALAVAGVLASCALWILRRPSGGRA